MTTHGFEINLSHRYRIVSTHPYNGETEINWTSDVREDLRIRLKHSTAKENRFWNRRIVDTLEETNEKENA